MSPVFTTKTQRLKQKLTREEERSRDPAAPWVSWQGIRVQHTFAHNSWTEWSQLLCAKVHEATSGFLHD